MPSELVNSVISRPHPPSPRITRRKSVSVTPAIGANTAAGVMLKSRIFSVAGIISSLSSLPTIVPCCRQFPSALSFLPMPHPQRQSQYRAETRRGGKEKPRLGKSHQTQTEYAGDNHQSYRVARQQPSAVNPERNDLRCGWFPIR